MEDSEEKEWDYSGQSLPGRLYAVAGTSFNKWSNAWTISFDPEREGWQTDCGRNDYGIPRAVAEEIVRCYNASSHAFIPAVVLQASLSGDLTKEIPDLYAAMDIVFRCRSHSEMKYCEPLRRLAAGDCEQIPATLRNEATDIMEIWDARNVVGVEVWLLPKDTNGQSDLVFSFVTHERMQEALEEARLTASLKGTDEN